MVQIGKSDNKSTKWCSFRHIVQCFVILIALLGYLMLSAVQSIHNDQITVHRVDKVPADVVQEKPIRKEPSKNNVNKQNANPTSSKAIAYAVTITGCGKPRENVDPFPIAEGAAVLKHSIAQQHAASPNYPDFVMYAIYHPNATACASTLGPLGYTLLERNTPVRVSDIQGDFLREKIVTNGCCGEKELIKFEAFTLTQHPAVVLLDLDALLLQPLDEVLDLLLQGKAPVDAKKHLMYPERPLPAHISLLHTIDYAMVNPGRKIKPFQGGFVILRPNVTVYKEFVELMRIGDFRESGGWGGKTGKFWGGQTFQGLMPYYYHILHPHQYSVELNWCTYNNMGSPSRDDGVVDDKPNGKCFTQQPDCEDCRARSVESVATTHFTVCQKPWICLAHERDRLEDRLCRQFHHAWFQARSELEISWGRKGWGGGKWNRDHFFGFCKSYGKKGYSLIEQPYGQGPIAVGD